MSKEKYFHEVSDRIDGCTTILTRPVSKLAKRKKYIARLAMASYIHGFWVAPEKIRGVCTLKYQIIIQDGINIQGGTLPKYS